MYFVNDSHEQNFDNLLKTFNRDNDREYATISYVYALPDIYSRCVNDPIFRDFPLAWKYEYENTSYVETDENGKYEVLDFEVKKDENGNYLTSDNYNYLSSGHKKMINMAENLFNKANNDFNLMDSLGVWDDKMIKVFYQALSIRLNTIKKEGDGEC